MTLAEASECFSEEPVEKRNEKRSRNVLWTLDFAKKGGGGANGGIEKDASRVHGSLRVGHYSRFSEAGERERETQTLKGEKGIGETDCRWRSQIFVCFDREGGGRGW